MVSRHHNQKVAVLMIEKFAPYLTYILFKNKRNCTVSIKRNNVTKNTSKLCVTFVFPERLSDYSTIRIGDVS